jgi:hypothetical protein
VLKGWAEAELQVNKKIERVRECEMIPPRDIDKLLLFFCDKRWRKVARIIGNSMLTLDDRGIRFSTRAIDARMAALVRNKRLEAAGNIRKWRFSEVRLAVTMNQVAETAPAFARNEEAPKPAGSREPRGRLAELAKDDLLTLGRQCYAQPDSGSAGLRPQSEPQKASRRRHRQRASGGRQVPRAARAGP